MYCLWLFSGIVRSPLLYSPLGQSNLVGGTVYCLWPFSGSFRHRPFLQSATSLVRPPVVDTYVYCLWTFYGIVRSPLSYSPLGQSNLVGTYVHFLWPFFEIVPSPFINIYDQSNLVGTCVLTLSLSICLYTGPSIEKAWLS